MPNPILDQDRVAFLQGRTKSGPVLLAAWPKQDKEMPQVEVEVDWVRFSTLNHRTRAEQMREIHKTKKPQLFSADPLGKEAQTAQYNILKSQDGFSALKDDLKERGQQDPAIITAEGVLINGNRRSAALRSLYNDDKYLKARYVKCLLLPQDATPEELTDLEAELQVARDFKESYSWINEALLIEELYEREGRNFDSVGTRMHLDPDDVRELHEKLQQVHQIVKLSNGARLHIDFQDHESAFDELTKHIRNKLPAEASGVKSAYFLGTLSAVNYRKLRHLRRPDAADLIMQEMANDASLKPLLETITGEAPASASPDILDDVLGAAPKPAVLDTVLSFLAKKKPEETITLSDGSHVTTKNVFESLKSAINAAADEAEEQGKDHTTLTAPLVRSDKAMAELNRIIEILPRARAMDGWKEADFLEKVAAIHKLLERMKNAQ